MALKRGNIVLVPFPFTDLSSRKVRPAVIISPDPQGEDILLAFISSSPSDKLAATDFLLESKHPDFSKTGLKRTSVFKLNKLLTLHHSVILRRLGSVSKYLQNGLDKRLAKAVGLAK
jgi:mRNA interferase MazF